MIKRKLYEYKIQTRERDFIGLQEAPKRTPDTHPSAYTTTEKLTQTPNQFTKIRINYN